MRNRLRCTALRESGHGGAGVGGIPVSGRRPGPGGGSRGSGDCGRHRLGNDSCHVKPIPTYLRKSLPGPAVLRHLRPAPPAPPAPPAVLRCCAPTPPAACATCATCATCGVRHLRHLRPAVLRCCGLRPAVVAQVATCGSCASRHLRCRGLR